MKKRKKKGYSVDLDRTMVTWDICKNRTSCFRYEIWEPTFSFPLGIAYMDRYGSERGNARGLLLRINVDDGVRNKGVGTELMYFIQGHYDIITTCSNEKSIGLLKKCGFIYSGLTDEWVWSKKG